MLQAIINTITILGFTLAILTWFRITPERLGQLTKTYVIKNWFTVITIAFTCSNITLIVLNVRSGNHNWWSYTEASWTPIFLWLIFIYHRFNIRRARILENIIMVAPMVLLLTSWGRLVTAINTGIFDNASPSLDKWLTLGLCGYNIFLVGMNIGLNIFFLLFHKRMDESKKIILKVEETFDKVTKLQEVFESRIDKSNSDEK